MKIPTKPKHYCVLDVYDHCSDGHDNITAVCLETGETGAETSDKPDCDRLFARVPGESAAERAIRSLDLLCGSGTHVVLGSA